MRQTSAKKDEHGKGKKLLGCGRGRTKGKRLGRKVEAKEKNKGKEKRDGGGGRGGREG